MDALRMKAESLGFLEDEAPSIFAEDDTVDADYEDEGAEEQETDWDDLSDDELDDLEDDLDDEVADLDEDEKPEPEDFDGDQDDAEPPLDVDLP